MKGHLQHDFTEILVLIGSSIKWIISAVIIGGIIGSITAGFLKVLEFGVGFTSNTWSYYYLLLPLGLFLSSYIVLKLAPSAEGAGTEKLIYAIHKKEGKINLRPAPVKILASIITIVLGGSAGKEIPSGGIVSSLSGLFNINSEDRKKLIVCGVSAGFAGVFGAPLAGAIFAAEVLYIGKFAYTFLFPALISSYVSYFITSYSGIQYSEYLINISSNERIKTFISMIIFGIFIGIVGVIFIRMLNITKSFFANKVKVYKPLRGVIGGIIIIVIILIAGGNTDFIGLGTEVIDKAIQGEKVGAMSFLGKIFTTSITLGSGGSGGILTPIFYVGASAGNTWAHLVNGNIQLFSAIGMVALLSACANTPLAAIIMAVELFEGEVASYASISCAISYLIVGHKSVFSTQIVTIAKTSSLDVNIDKEVGELNGVKVSFDKSSVINKIKNKAFSKEAREENF